MLQRPQTLYLLGALVLAIFLFTGPIALISVDGTEYILRYSGLYNGLGERLELVTWPLTLLFVLVSLLVFLNIFFYKNRIRQMRVTVFLILLFAGTAGMMFYYTFIAGNQWEGAAILHQWRFVVPPVVMILLYLAFRRIRRDELLVKAYERIR